LPPCYIVIQETSRVQSQNLESIQETVDTIGLLVVRGQQIATDVVGLIDEWAARFFEELDYINEGENGTRFAEMMRVDLPQVSCSHDNLLH
jgi:predicted unusual protein kinase regulating ubiquinone biosynthesis (AarF/ABC1/UbiB family)